MQTGDTNNIYGNELDKACFQHDMTYVVYTFFDKKSKGTGIKAMPNQQLTNELHKPIIRKFFKKSVFFF